MTTDDQQLNRVRAVFDAWAERGRGDSMAESHTPFVRQAFARLPLRTNSWYLDIGCGTGYTVRWAATLATAGRSVGIDLSPGMIERARALSRDFGNVEFHVATFPDRHPLPYDRFDVVFSMEVLYYLPDLAVALEEVRRLLAPGGTFACQVDYYAENVASHPWPDDVGVRMTLLDEAGWRSALARAGLEITDQFRVRVPAAEASESWKATEGSLVTVGRRTV